MSPPLLQPAFPWLARPMMVSREMTDDFRCKAVLKIRTTPMLLVSTTYPLPAHRPWSAGSMSSPNVLPLSTAFRPFTPVAPPEDKEIASQPGRTGWQLTVGGTVSVSRDVTSALLPEGPRRGRPWIGIAFGLRDGIADSVSGLAAVASLEATDAVDGEKKGPVSKEQPGTTQPVAAGPTKVGENCPKLVDVMALVGALDVSVSAVAASTEMTASATATTISVNRD